MKVVLLPGLDGTGDLFELLIKVIAHRVGAKGYILSTR